MKDVKKVRRLPGYWLGTRQPSSLGYQSNQGIGTPEATTTPGEDLNPEVRAAQSNIIPGALQKTMQIAQQPASMLMNYTTGAAAAAANAAANANIASFGSGLMNSTMPGMQTLGANLQAIGEGGGVTAAKAGLNAAGKAAGIVGAAAGAYGMYNDFARAGDVRSMGDMEKTMARSTYYTPGGHSYTRHGGLNLGAELAYGRAKRDSNRLGLTLDAMGTGAGIGGLFGPVGMGIGAGIGALFGGAASLLGFGDNEEKIKRQAIDLMDSIARSDKQSEALAKNLDTREGFYNRGGAVNGKRPVQSAFGPIDRKATARVSNGELIGNFEDGYVSEVPGRPNNKDSKLAWLRPSDFVISNKFGLSDYAKATGDYEGALNMQDILMTQYKNKACNGKLPKFALGTAAEYALSALPHLGQYFSSQQAYNRAKNASTYVPTWEGYNALGASAINQMYSDMIDPRQYLNMSNRSYNQAAWNARRTPGMGLGGRAVMLDSLYRAKLAQDAETMMKIDESNRAQRNAAGQMKYTMGDKALTTQYDNFWKRYAAQQQANAAKENWMAQYEKNMVLAGINGAADLLRMNQYNRAYDIQNRMIGLYDRQANLDWEKFRAAYPDWNPAASTPTTTRRQRVLTKDQRDILLGRKGIA